MAMALFRKWFIDPTKDGLPEGWEECTLNDLCLKIASGGTPSTKIKEYYDGHINWYSTKELNDGFLFESEKKITLQGLENSSAKLFPKGTIVMAIYAAPTVGRLGILTNEDSFNQAACGLVPNTEVCSTEFLYLYLKSERENLNIMASGSAQQNLNVNKIKTYPTIKVPKNIMIRFNKIVRPIFHKIENNSYQIQTLEKLRDTLLPKLMSGELRIKL
jgi:type I restriction enzyme S subunit